MSVEGYLIEHCAPTLASLKTASLFSCPCRGRKTCKKSLPSAAAAVPQGRGAGAFARGERSALVYVYRKGRLARELSARPVAAFLRQLGYCDLSEEGAIACLAGRLAARGGFPHEIGLFLGYPLCDVQGFIRHAGRHCKCCRLLEGVRRRSRGAEPVSKVRPLPRGLPAHVPAGVFARTADGGGRGAAAWFVKHIWPKREEKEHE